jgi:hypothetical protein
MRSIHFQMLRTNQYNQSVAKLVTRPSRALRLAHFLDETNANPKPFTWTKNPNKIIAAVKQGTKC